MCLSIFTTFSLLLNHWFRVDGQDPNLNIVCGVGGCGRTYRNFGYRSHLQRNHNQLWKNASEITELGDLLKDVDHEEHTSDDCDNAAAAAATSGDSFVANEDEEDRESGDDSHHDENNEDEASQLICSRAAYLLRITETHNLTQKALNDIVANTNMLIRDAVKTTCETVVNTLIETPGENYSERIGWEVLFDQNAKTAKPFQGMETERDQRQKFKELFGFVVSSHRFFNMSCSARPLKSVQAHSLTTRQTNLTINRGANCKSNFFFLQVNLWLS